MPYACIRLKQSDNLKSEERNTRFNSFGLWCPRNYRDYFFFPINKINIILGVQGLLQYLYKEQNLSSSS